jgi:putative 4-mercaptohistidine N1-methyltranferase
VADNIYETDRLVREYLLFHYGSVAEILPWAGGPIDALDFAVRCVGELLDPAALGPHSRALDIGCAVGRSSFELARHCQDVAALDFSQAFITAAERLCCDGEIAYEHTVEGLRTATATARVPSGVDPSRVRFAVGDAMALPEDLGPFDVVLAANLLCRLPDPRVFLSRLPFLVKPGGQLLLTTPFTWLAEFTPPDKWIGGQPSRESTAELKALLAPHFELQIAKDLPFLIREHSRKFQWSVAWGTRWVRV